jgi:hypothetical protein
MKVEVGDLVSCSKGTSIVLGEVYNDPEVGLAVRAYGYRFGDGWKIPLEHGFYNTSQIFKVLSHASSPIEYTIHAWNEYILELQEADVQVNYLSSYITGFGGMDKYKNLLKIRKEKYG